MAPGELDQLALGAEGQPAGRCAQPWRGRVSCRATSWARCWAAGVPVCCHALTRRASARSPAPELTPSGREQPVNNVVLAPARPRPPGLAFREQPAMAGPAGGRRRDQATALAAHRADRRDPKICRRDEAEHPRAPQHHSTRQAALGRKSGPRGLGHRCSSSDGLLSDEEHRDGVGWGWNVGWNVAADQDL